MPSEAKRESHDGAIGIIEGIINLSSVAINMLAGYSQAKTIVNNRTE